MADAAPVIDETTDVPPIDSPDPVPGATETTAEPAVYDLAADPAGLLALDLGGAKIGGQYANVGEALEALKGAQDALAVPEVYDFGEAGKAWSDETRGEVDAFLRAANVPGASAALLAPKISEVVNALTAFKTLDDLGDYWGLPKPQLTNRINEIKAWFASPASANVPAKIKEGWAREGAWGYRAAYQEMTRDWEKPVFNPESEGTPRDERSRADRIFGGKK